MKTIGLLGGMSWESTALYYQQINTRIRERCGGLASAPIILLSVNFQPIEQLLHAGNWAQISVELAQAAQRVEAAGADGLLLCTNTMHKVADAISAAVTIPLLHIADATAQQIKAQGVDSVGLLATAATMEQDFYIQRLREHGLQVLVPEAADRALVNRVIFEELCQGVLKDSSRQAYLAVMDKLQAQGAQAIIQGCTEITLLVTAEHTDIPLFDTTAIHAARAVEFALDT